MTEQSQTQKNTTTEEHVPPVKKPRGTSTAFKLGFFTPIILVSIFFTSFFIMPDTPSPQSTYVITQATTHLAPLQQAIEKNITFSTQGTPHLPNPQAYNTQVEQIKAATLGIKLLTVYDNGDIILVSKLDPEKPHSDNIIIRLRPEQKGDRVQWSTLANSG